jgi:hypothetical protein
VSYTHANGLLREFFEVCRLKVVYIKVVYLKVGFLALEFHAVSATRVTAVSHFFEPDPGLALLWTVKPSGHVAHCSKINVCIQYRRMRLQANLIKDFLF